MSASEVIVDVLWIAGGLVLLGVVADSAVRTFILPRGAAPVMTHWVFEGLRGAFDLVANRCSTYAARDRIMALYGPVGLLVLPLVWILFVATAFAAGFHALGVRGFWQSFEMSGSSLLTLGFVRPPDGPTTTLAFAEAIVGLGLLALLISYLPAIYSAFSRREVLVSQLAMRAGEPPTGVTVLTFAHRMGRSHLLDELWRSWQQWFAEVEETHTSLAVLGFFRSPKPGRSWITAAGAVLDAASLELAALDTPYDPDAGLCVRGGGFSLRDIAAHFALPFDPDPQRGDPISITREEFDEACDELAAVGLAVRTDRDEAWLDFAGWRVNYDRALLGICGLVMAPYAPWSSDRSFRLRFRRLRARAARRRDA